MTKENLLQHLQECCDRLFGCSLEMATEKQVYRAVCVAVRDLSLVGINIKSSHIKTSFSQTPRPSAMRATEF